MRVCVVYIHICDVKWGGGEGGVRAWVCMWVLVRACVSMHVHVCINIHTCALTYTWSCLKRYGIQVTPDNHDSKTKLHCYLHTPAQFLWAKRTFWMDSWMQLHSFQAMHYHHQLSRPQWRRRKDPQGRWAWDGTAAGTKAAVWDVSNNMIKWVCWLLRELGLGVERVGGRC